MPGTLGNVDQQVINTRCRECRRYGASIPARELIERFGPDVPFAAVVAAMRCKECGAKGPEIWASFDSRFMGR